MGEMARRVVLLTLLAALALAALGQDPDNTPALTDEQIEAEKDDKVGTSGIQAKKLANDKASNLAAATSSLSKSLNRRNQALQAKTHKPVQKAFVSSMPSVVTKKSQAEKTERKAKQAENATESEETAPKVTMADSADCDHSENVSLPCPARPCGDHGFLVDFVCNCEDGWQGANCTIPVCLHNCHNAGMCQNGSCVCDERVTGVYCQHCKGGYNASSFPRCDKDVASCPGNCSGHGQCELDGTCTCEKPFNGTDCGYIACPGDCSGHGECETEIGMPRGVKRGSCVCADGWSGEDCGTGTCPNMCSGHGLCHRDVGECSCHPGWSGKKCAIRLCPNDCGGILQGKCIQETGKCQCKGTWGGADCSIRDAICPYNCSLHGLCKLGKCDCFSDYEGEFCSLRKCPNNCNCGANMTTGPAGAASQNYSDCNGLCDKNTGFCKCIGGFSGADCSEKAPTNAPGAFGCRRQCKDQCSKEAEAAKQGVFSSKTGSQDEVEKCLQDCEGKCVNSQVKPAVALKSNGAAEPNRDN